MTNKKTWGTETLITTGILGILFLAVLFATIAHYSGPGKSDTRITQRMIIQFRVSVLAKRTDITEVIDDTDHLVTESYTIRTQLQYFDEHWYIARSWTKTVPWSEITKTRNLQRTQAEEWRKHLKMVLREFYKQP